MSVGCCALKFTTTCVLYGIAIGSAWSLTASWGSMSHAGVDKSPAIAPPTVLTPVATANAASEVVLVTAATARIARPAAVVLTKPSALSMLSFPTPACEATYAEARVWRERTDFFLVLAGVWGVALFSGTHSTIARP